LKKSFSQLVPSSLSKHTKILPSYLKNTSGLASDYRLNLSLLKYS